MKSTIIYFHFMSGSMWFFKVILIPQAQTCWYHWETLSAHVSSHLFSKLTTYLLIICLHITFSEVEGLQWGWLHALVDLPAGKCSWYILDMNLGRQEAKNLFLCWKLNPGYQLYLFNCPKQVKWINWEMEISYQFQKSGHFLVNHINASLV